MKRVLVYDSKPYDHKSFTEHNNPRQTGVEFEFIKYRLDEKTVSLAKNFEAICIFVHDCANREVLLKLKKLKIKLIILRCAGFNNLDLSAAKELGIKVFRVPEYSPNAVAEHAVALLMALNRKVYRSFRRVTEGNFSLDGLLGFDLFGKTVGLIGTGKIGKIFARIIKGFGTEVIAFDRFPDEEAAQEIGFSYVNLEEVYRRSDVISLHVPLLEETNHMINENSISQMKDGVTIINTSRGKLIDTKALVAALKSRKISGAGLDVYEDEDSYFFEDWSNKIMTDDVLARLISFNNVLVTSHQAFFTREALTKIAQTCLENLRVGFSEDPKENSNQLA